MPEDTLSVLLTRTAKGDTSAFEELFTLTSPKVYSYLRLKCSQEDAKDILQETYLSVWRGADGYTGKSGITTWIISIARNKLCDMYRKRGQTTVELDEALLPHTEGPDGEGLELRLALSALPDEERELVYLTYTLGLSCSETGVLLNIPEGTVKSRLSRIRKKLRASLSDGGE
ncbi:MAG: RNA polymerase sigma factor [Eubacteriales bacterium]